MHSPQHRGAGDQSQVTHTLTPIPSPRLPHLSPPHRRTVRSTCKSPSKRERVCVLQHEQRGRWGLTSRVFTRKRAASAQERPPRLAQISRHDPCEHPSGLRVPTNHAPEQPEAADEASISALHGSEHSWGKARGRVVQPGGQTSQAPSAWAVCPRGHTTPCTQSSRDADPSKDDQPVGQAVQLSLPGAL